MESPSSASEGAPSYVHQSPGRHVQFSDAHAHYAAHDDAGARVSVASSAYMMMDYRHTDELDTTMLAPASRGKHVPLLGSSIRPRRGQRRRIHSAWCCVGLVAIALLGLGCIIGISALLANHSPAPPGLTGLQGYTAQVPTRAAFDAYVAFLNNTLSLDNVVTCSDASSPDHHAIAVSVLPNGDTIAVTLASDAAASGQHVDCPVMHFLVDDVGTWTEHLRRTPVDLVGSKGQCGGVTWQYFKTPDGNMFAVSNSSNMLGLVAPPQSGLGPAGPGLQRAQILGIPEANLLYNKPYEFNDMFQFMTNAIGLTCDPCGGPGAGQLTVFTMPNGNRLQLYYMDPGQGQYLNYCPAPGLAVGTLELLEQWREDLLSRHEPVLSPIIESSDRAYFWLESPVGKPWTSPTQDRNVLRLVASELPPAKQQHEHPPRSGKNQQPRKVTLQ